MFGMQKVVDWWKEGEQQPAPNSNVDTGNGGTQATQEARSQAGGSEQIAIGAQNSKDNPAVDTFKDIWKVSEEEQKRINESTQQPVVFGADVTPEKIFEASRQIDFMQTIPKELMEKAQSGDAQALQQVINAVGQNAYAQAALTSKTASETAVKQVNDHWQTQLPDLIRKHMQRNEISEANPVANNPAYKPIYDSIVNQLQLKHPQANTAEIQKHATQYFHSFIKDFGGTIPTQQQQSPNPAKGNGGDVKADGDWGGFFN